MKFPVGRRRSVSYSIQFSFLSLSLLLACFDTFSVPYTTLVYTYTLYGCCSRNVEKTELNSPLSFSLLSLNLQHFNISHVYNLHTHTRIHTL